MAEQLFTRLTNSLFHTTRFIPSTELFSQIKDISKPVYYSTYYYNNAQVDFIKADPAMSVKGITDVVTDHIWWDFDVKKGSTQTLDDTFSDVKTLIARLQMDKYALQLYFSGNKGFHLLAKVHGKLLNRKEVEAFCIGNASDLQTFDPSLYDYSQVLRLPFTLNNKSGIYYKTPIQVSDINSLSVDTILDMAKEPYDFETIQTFDTQFHLVTITIPATPTKKEKPITVDTGVPSISALSKPAVGWKNYKWALANGYFEAGQRHDALMVVAATCRGLGYTKEQTYYMCKSALKKQADMFKSDEYDKEELWKNIIEDSVFSATWNGGQYSYANSPWLQLYCQKWGFKVKNESTEASIKIDDMSTEFKDFAVNFEKNLIKTGLKSLDEKLTLSTSTLNGLLGQPGSGKTSNILNMMEFASTTNIPCMFFSLDMGLPLIYGKLLQKESGMDFKEITKLFQNGSPKIGDIQKSIHMKYKNVNFCFRSGLTVNDMKTEIEKVEEISGQKIKLVVVDYLECIGSTMSDSTAASGNNALLLKDLANDTETCVMVLLQTQKHSVSDVTEPLLSLKNVKGSSLIEQSCSSIITLWREGYSPKYVENDNFISFAVVKNRFGALWSGDFHWDGLRGEIRELFDEERVQLKDLREKKKNDKMKTEEGDSIFGNH